MRGLNLQKKRWLILVASCFVTLCIGSLYAWSAFAAPMGAYLTEYTGHEIASLAIVFTVANAVSPVTMISGGYINDKMGPKAVLLVGGLLFGVPEVQMFFCVHRALLVERIPPQHKGCGGIRDYSSMAMTLSTRR